MGMENVNIISDGNTRYEDTGFLSVLECEEIVEFTRFCIEHESTACTVTKYDDWVLFVFTGNNALVSTDAPERRRIINDIDNTVRLGMILSYPAWVCDLLYEP